MISLKKYIAIFWPGVLVIIAIIGGFRLHSDFKRSSESRLVDLKASIDRIESDLANSQKLVDYYLASKQALKPYLSMMFPPMKPEFLIERIKNTARAHRVEMTNIQLDVPKFIEIRGKKEAVSIVPFEISFSGDFMSLGKFLEEFEKAPYLQSVTEMGMADKVESGEVIDLTIKGAFRFFKKDTVKELTDDGI